MTKQEQEQIKLNTFLNTMFYSYELENLTDDKEIINTRLNDIKEHIEQLNQNDLYSRTEQILNNSEFMDLLARTLTIDDIDEKRLNDLIDDYNNVFNFFKNEKENAYNILQEYNGIVTKDNEGFYRINDTIIDKVIKDNDFYISNTDDKDELKKSLFDIWENQKELITQEKLNEYSKKRNGIAYKYFIFCEEYIKRGKIKPTCEHLGISRNTAYLWLKEQEVQDYLKSRQDEIKQETDNTFLNTYNTCFDELNHIIKSDYADRGEKIKAIDVFLKHYSNLERIKQLNNTYED